MLLLLPAPTSSAFLFAPQTWLKRSVGACWRQTRTTAKRIGLQQGDCGRLHACDMLDEHAATTLPQQCHAMDVKAEECEVEAEECEVEADAEHARAEEAARLAAEAEARAKTEAQAQARAKAAAARAESKPPQDAHDALHWAAAKGNATELKHRALKRWPLDVRQVAVTSAEFIDKPSRFSRRPDWIAATPLYEAASRGHTDCVQLLLAAHAAVDLPTNTGDTPLHAACGRGYSECVQLLLAARAVIDRPARSGATPLLSALQSRQDEAALVLIEAHADVGAVLRDGRGVLHCAAFVGTPIPVCEELLAAGASCDARDARGRMPLHMAAACGYAALAMRLIVQGAPLNALDDDGNDALSLAGGGVAVEAVAREMAEEAAAAAAAAGEAAAAAAAAAAATEAAAAAAATSTKAAAAAAIAAAAAAVAAAAAAAATATARRSQWLESTSFRR